MPALRWTLLFLISALCCELASAQGGRRGGRRGFARPDPILTALDADEDRALSAEEIAAAGTALVSLDKNGDGNITKDELQPEGRGGRRRRGPGGPGGRGGSPLLDALDLDRDAELFEDEVTDAAAALKTLDADADGVLSEDELRPQRGGRFGGGGPPGGGPPNGAPGGGPPEFGGRGEGPPPGERGPGGPPGSERDGEAEGGAAPEPSELDFEDGVARIPDRATYEKLSYQGEEVMIDVSLKGVEFVKFTIVGAETDAPKIYFINTKTYRAHPMFSQAIGLPGGRGRGESGQMRGVLSYRPMVEAPSGDAGLYTFEFNPQDRYAYERVSLARDLLVQHAPILAGKLAHYPLPAALDLYEEEKEQYEAGKLPIFSPDDLFGNIAFLPLHHATSYGILRLMNPGDRPGVRDVVVYPTLPNEMPRVAGILTGVRQTPLSHVNLRAIQDDVPNAYVKGAESLEAITSLYGKYVKYEVTADGYTLTEVPSEEVDAHFEALRPSEDQTPVRDLTVTDIRPLKDVAFTDSSRVGVKAANLAAMHRFGLPAGTVPDGFAVPFSFYDAFMRHNGFYEQAAEMIAAPEFSSDAKARSKALKSFRKAIKKAEFPKEQLDALGLVQEQFAGASFRCRSSTNNEDLPGFSGAGLYDSFTHHPDEGHLQKSIKQVYASLWNFRAFEERAFYRISHADTAMGVLLHPNAKNEQANGVAVTEDIVYQSANQGPLLYYVNAQVGEDLVTNPDAGAVPEEILLAPRNPATDRLVQTSSLAKDGARVLTDEQLLLLRRHLRVIEKQFRKLYAADATDAPFAMEIEFKILEDGRLSIKQARPWVF